MRNLLQTLVKWTQRALLGAVAAATPSIGVTSARALPATAPAPATRPATQPVVADFVPWVIKDDRTYTNMEVTRGMMPKGWTIKGGVVWTIDDAFPAQFRIHFGDEQDICALDDYPNMDCCFGKIMAGRTRFQGAEVLKPPADQFDAILTVIVPRFRPELANAKVVDKVKKPEWAKAAYEKIKQVQGYQYAVWAGIMTFEYQIKGQTVKEQVALTYKRETNPKLGFVLWYLENVSSARFTEDTRESVRVYRKMMIESVHPNPAWTDKVEQFIIAKQKMNMNELQDQMRRTKLFADMVARKTAEEYQREAAQTMAGSEAATEGTSDLLRNVTPWNTGGGMAKLPSGYSYAWENPAGQVHMTNDPTYDPNSDPAMNSTTWTRITPVRR
jgi:hypothetical protein